MGAGAGPRAHGVAVRGSIRKSRPPHQRRRPSLSALSPRLAFSGGGPAPHDRRASIPLHGRTAPNRARLRRGSSGRTGEFGPFEDTTDPACLAWRDRTRRRIWTALEHLDLPAGSRNDVWIPICFCLIAAELEGRALYEVSIGARDLFAEWTRAAASPGSTKPDMAADVFDGLAADFDLDRPQVGSLEGLYARARAAGWDGRAADAGDHESADASEQEHETSDTESGGAADGADSTGRQENAETEPPKRGRGRPRGSRNKAGSARQEREERAGRGDEGRLRLHLRAEERERGHLLAGGVFHSPRGCMGAAVSGVLREEDREAHRGSKGHGYSAYRAIHVRLPGHPPAGTPAGGRGHRAAGTGTPLAQLSPGYRTVDRGDGLP